MRATVPIWVVAEKPLNGPALHEWAAAAATPAAALLNNLRRESTERIMMFVFLLCLEFSPSKSSVPGGGCG